MKAQNSDTTAGETGHDNGADTMLVAHLHAHRVYSDLERQRRDLLRRLTMSMLAADGWESCKTLVERMDEIEEIQEFLRGEHEDCEMPNVAA